MIIKAKQLSKIYGSNNNKVIALNNVNLEINSGEFVSVIGPSGSGKSTLLHILSGLDNPTSGQVLLDDKDIYKHTEKELSALRRKSFGFVFQQFNLLPVLTASENISMPVLLDKKQPDKEYLNEISSLLGIAASPRRNTAPKAGIRMAAEHSFPWLHIICRKSMENRKGAHMESQQKKKTGKGSPSGKVWLAGAGRRQGHQPHAGQYF